MPVKDTTPRHGDSRRSGWATYPQKPIPRSTSQDVGPQGASNPNGVGPVMRAPYDATAGVFEGSNGFDQEWNEEQALDVPQPYAPQDDGD